MTTARRGAPADSGRRLSLVVLIAGSVAALLTVAGPDWLARVGVGIAVLVAAGSNLLAWRELTLERRRHAQAMLKLSQAHGVAMREERRHNAAVVATLSGRARDAASTIEAQQLAIGELHVEVATLEGRTIQLRSEARRRETALESLHRSMARRDAELEVLRAAAEAAAEREAAQPGEGGHGTVDLQSDDEYGAVERTGPDRMRAKRVGREQFAAELAELATVVDRGQVRSLPRRMRLESDERSPEPAAETARSEQDLWPDRTPGVADLAAADRDAERLRTELASRLPNFEADRRWA